MNHEERYEKIEEKFEQMVTKDELYNRLDNMLGILNRLGHERIFTTEWVKRLENEVNCHSQEIAQIKESLHVSE